MSWFSRSFASSLMASDDDEAEAEPKNAHQSTSQTLDDDRGPVDPGSPTRGVKDDISELTKTISRQFWGVASFLAPPPSTSTPSPDPAEHVESEPLEAVESPRIAGIRSDFAEIGGRFRSGISKLSSNKTVTEISKIASTFLPFGAEEEEDEEGEDDGGGAIGVTDEVLVFARNISMHPETWLDFPLFVYDEESDDFNMSNAQQEHALAVEHLEPRLAALRIELCPSHMSEGCFWKIYFVLLHSRLNKHDAELLSTPQIVEARAKWLQELQNLAKPESTRLKEDLPSREETVVTTSPKEQANILNNEEPQSSKIGKVISIPITDIETEKHPVEITEIEVVDKSVIEVEPPAQPKHKDLADTTSEITIQKFDEDVDEWLEEDTEDMGTSIVPTIPIGNEEDVSFSDLEDVDDPKAP
ncbi:BSD domain-containing protein [Dioscorea alata]|uniref:BSD domain-containing protein n=1 Tax=Dioscorea alata TaxID=55571 RepID=A0ACB7WNQ5_DIOAL|nr:BSD domain-containing protein [Dioscorea alata]